MKITIYELLGKVKDDNQTDIYAKFLNRLTQAAEIMRACKENIIYKLDQNIIKLNDEVEMIEQETIEEDKEYEDIEEIDLQEKYLSYQPETDEMKVRINSLIKNQKKLIDEVNKLKNK